MTGSFERLGREIDQLAINRQNVEAFLASADAAGFPQQISMRCSSRHPGALVLAQMLIGFVREDLDDFVKAAVAKLAHDEQAARAQLLAGAGVTEQTQQPAPPAEGSNGAPKGNTRTTRS